MGRPDLFRALAIVALIGVFIATLVAINRRPATPVVPDVPSASAPDDISAELRRCSALSQQDAEDPRCQAVWEENRRRFLGRRRGRCRQWPRRPTRFRETRDEQRWRH